MSTTTSSSISKQVWLDHIMTMLNGEDVAATPVCIYKVTQILRDTKPEAYEPQLIGFGPYHHCHDDLFVMEHKKLVVSKKSQKGCLNGNEAVKRLEYLVRCLMDDIADVRASYDRDLDADNDILAWMMVIDTIFLLQFLQVIIRNLVAYEAQAIPCPSYLARYTELMNGIIDTKEDVKLLRDKGIIVSYLKKDEDVAELWNEMSRSIRLSHVPCIDKVIEEVNKCYNNKKDGEIL